MITQFENKQYTNLTSDNEKSGEIFRRNLLPILVVAASSLYGVNGILDLTISFSWILVFIMSIRNRRYYFLLGGLAIFQNVLMFMGYSVYSIIMVIGALSVFYNNRRHIKIESKSTSIFILITALYGLFIFLYYSMSIVFIVSFLSMLLVVMSEARRLAEKECLSLFSLGLVAAILSSAVNGLIMGNSDSYFINDVGMQINRLQGVNADPNYMAMAVILGIALLGFAMPRNRHLTRLGLLILFVIGFATSSTTFYICACVYVITRIYTSLRHRPVMRLLLSISFIILVLLIATYQDDVVSLLYVRLSSTNPSVARLLIQLNGLNSNDFSTFTSGRTRIWSDYMNYFFNQPMYKIFFGGNLSCIYGVGDYFTRESIYRASHSTYIDIMMCTGITGLTVFLYIVIKRINAAYRKVFTDSKQIDRRYLSLVIAKIVILVFYASLSAYPSWYTLIILLL